MSFAEGVWVALGLVVCVVVVLATVPGPPPLDVRMKMLMKMSIAIAQQIHFVPLGAQSASAAPRSPEGAVRASSSQF